MEVPEQFGKPYLAFLQSLQDAVMERDALLLLSEAYGRYLDLAEAAAESDLARESAEAFAAYESTIAGTIAPERATAIFHDYFEAIRNAFGEPAADDLSPEVVAMIAQHLGWAAWTANSVAAKRTAQPENEERGPSIASAVESPTSLPGTTSVTS